METIAEYKIKIPTWALSYLAYGDDSGITQEEKSIIDTWLQEYENAAREIGGKVILGEMEPEQESYFTWDPEFGEACDVEDYTILIVK